ncbi:hypothetical protein [Rhizobacter fulvus]
MHPEDLIVRCMARREGDVYVAVCIDFTLAAQGDSFEDATQRLHGQINSYVQEAFAVDLPHAAELLTRKAPLWHRIQYRLCQFRARRESAKRGYAYAEALPMRPAFA